MIVLERISDGAIFPYSPKTASKPGFAVVDDEERKPFAKGKPRPLKKKRTSPRQALDALEVEFQDFDENALIGYVAEEFSVEFPADSRREDLLKMIRDRRAAQALVQSVLQPPAGAPAVTDPALGTLQPSNVGGDGSGNANTDAAPPAGRGNKLTAMNKAQLIEFGKTKYAVDLPPESTKEQMIAQLTQLAADTALTQ